MLKRSQTSSFMSSLALLYAAMFAQLAAAQNFERLPLPTYPIAQLQRLPRADDRPAENGAPLESGELIKFAGGRVELLVPRGWRGEEVPVGREIRFVIAPQGPANLRRMPIDGMWIAYHAAPVSESQSDDSLSRELSERVQSAVDRNGRITPPTPFQFGRWPAAVAEFSAREPTSANTPITGRHVLVRTEWGLFEFHASAPDAIAESRGKIWSATWESLRLNPPADLRGSAQDGSSEPNTIIGDWKAYRSRMRFGADGRVVIVPDALDGNRPAKPLTGTFEAHDDLVFVRWDDGSRLNLRWRLQGHDLFLTDHEGQISHLKRVFN